MSSYIPLAFAKKSRPSGYRTAGGSERDEDSTRHNDGHGAIDVDQNTKQIPFSLSPYPARYRERFCTKRFVGFHATDSKMTSWADHIPLLKELINSWNRWDL